MKEVSRIKIGFDGLWAVSFSNVNEYPVWQMSNEWPPRKDQSNFFFYSAKISKNNSCKFIK